MDAALPSLPVATEAESASIEVVICRARLSGSTLDAFNSGLMAEMKLVWPSPDYLPSYVDALRRGWSPDNLRADAAAREELEQIAANPETFLASLVDFEPTGLITLPDGTKAPRLPGYRRWMWDGEFSGSIGFRWQPGTEALPPYCLGHIGYSVVPWKQRLGYATRALREVLRDAKERGLGYVEITTDPSNTPSQRVIEANGGVLIEEFLTSAAYGNKPELRYRVHLGRAPNTRMEPTARSSRRRAPRE